MIHHSHTHAVGATLTHRQGNDSHRAMKRHRRPQGAPPVRVPGAPPPSIGRLPTFSLYDDSFFDTKPRTST